MDKLRPQRFQHDVVLAPCAIRNPDQPAGGVASGALQTRAFRQAHPPGIDPVQAHVGLPVVDQPEHVPDRRHAQHPWALWAFPGAHTHEDRPRALQRALVPAADAGEREASLPLRDRLLGEHVQAVRPARRYTELIRSPSVGGLEVLDGGELALRGWGAPPRRCRPSSLRRPRACMAPRLCAVLPLEPIGAHEAGRSMLAQPAASAKAQPHVSGLEWPTTTEWFRATLE